MYCGKKIRLRAYRKEDAEYAWSYINDEEIRRFLVPGIPFPITLMEEEKWIEGQSSSSDTYNFAIETLDEGKYIGGCGINNLDWKNSVATVGIFLGKGYLSKGYGTDAMNTLVGFIFDQMNINKVKLHVYAFNERAIKSYKKCGFKLEGTLRQEIFRDGRYYDEYVMGILREEYDNLKL